MRGRESEEEKGVGKGMRREGQGRPGEAWGVLGSPGEAWGGLVRPGEEKVGGLVG